MALTQRTFRIRTDAGAVDATPTWGAAQDVNFSPAVETNFRVRFSVNNTTPSASGPFVLRLSKNGGAYAAITTSSTGGIQSANASSDADEAVIATANIRLGAGTGTVATGVYDETGSATKTMATNTYNEFEFGLIIKSANVAGGDTLDLRIYNSTTAFTTYTQTPRITVPDNNRACLANDVVSASSVTKPALALTATSTAPGAHLVTGYTPGSGRQDLTGEVGLRAHMIVNQTVTWVGLLMQASYTGTQQLALRNTDGSLITSTAFDATGKTAGTWYWVPIPPTALVSGSYYCVTKATVASDGQLWPNAGATTLDAALSDEARAVFRTTGAFDAGVASPTQYVGVDLGWTPPVLQGLLANDIVSPSSVSTPNVMVAAAPKLAGRMHQYRMRRA